MKRKMLRVAFSIVALSFITSPTHSITAQKSANYVKMPEQGLRGRATKTVVPIYPEESQKNGASGVSVTRIEVDEEGNVTEVEILQAPDRFIETALIEAIKEWKFQPFDLNGNPRRLVGKLVFYFVIDGGKARVDSPKFRKLPVKSHKG